MHQRLLRKIIHSWKIILKSDLSQKFRAFPYNDDSSRGTNGGDKFKAIKLSQAEVSHICLIKSFTFCFLEANNIAFGFINFATKSNPFMC
jgi:hypothetical protein